MEYGSIEREIHVDASPEVVFEVVSRPEHISQWWTDDAEIQATPGAVGELVWGDRAQVVPIKVVNADRDRIPGDGLAGRQVGRAVPRTQRGWDTFVPRLGEYLARLVSTP